MPVLDPYDLDRLSEELQSRHLMADVAERYRRMLPRRIDRLTTAVAVGDLDVAMDAVLSLRVSSTTVGAREMEELARHLEMDVRRGDVNGARDRIVPLPRAAERADEALGAFLRLSTAC